MGVKRQKGPPREVQHNHKYGNLPPSENESSTRSTDSRKAFLSGHGSGGDGPEWPVRPRSEGRVFQEKGFHPPRRFTFHSTAAAAAAVAISEAVGVSATVSSAWAAAFAGGTCIVVL